MDYAKLLKAVKAHGNLTDDELKDAAEHGADGGWQGFTYYTDTARFYDKNEKLIWDLLEAMADDLGTTPLKLVSNFKCADAICDLPTFKNALAWFALEEAGRLILDRLEANT